MNTALARNARRAENRLDRTALKPKLLATAITMALCAPATSWGQSGAADDDELTSGRLETITVTARKVEETIQDAPVAVSAFTAEDIRRQGLVDVDSLARLTPGLSFSQAFGRSSDRPVIRGQSNVLARVQFGVESGTAYFIDGVYYNGDLQSINFNALERVEVIKGPQSALYGRNTYAGAINFITRDPTNEFTGSFKLLGAEYNEREFAGWLSGPIIENALYFRLGARYYEYGGQYVNTLTGNKVGDEQTRSLNAALIYNAGGIFDARLNIMYNRDDDGPLALFLQPAIDNNCEPGFRSAAFRRAFFPPIRGGGPRVSTNNFQYYCGGIKARPDLLALNTDPLPDGTPDGTAFDGIFARNYFTALSMNWDLNDWTLTSQTGWRGQSRRFGTDSDHSDAFVVFVPAGVPVPPGTAPLFMNTTRSETEEWSQEIRLASPTDRRTRFMVGAFYYDYNMDDWALTFQQPVRGNPFGATDEITNQALFGLVSHDITDRLTLTAEIRYQEEDKSRLERNPTTGAQTFFAEETFKATTPRLTLDYTIDDDRMVYFVYAKGAKPGGINGSIGQLIGFPTYAQEKSDNLEVGLKSFWLDRRLQMNAAVFFIDAKDVQLTTALPDPGGSAINSVATNQGATETFGLELELRALLTDNLILNASYALADSEFTSGCDDAEYTLNTGGLLIPAGFDGPECSIKGRQTPISSRHQATLGLDFRMPFSGNLEFFAAPTWSYESKKYIQVHNRAYIPATHIVNLRAGVRSQGGWEIAAFVRNLFDDDTPTMATRWFDLRHGFDAFGIPPEQLVSQGCNINSGNCADAGTPRAFFAGLRKGRTFGIELRYDF